MILLLFCRLIFDDNLEDNKKMRIKKMMSNFKKDI